MTEKLTEKLEKMDCYICGFKNTKIIYNYNDGKKNYKIGLIFNYNKNYPNIASISYFRRDLIRLNYDIKNIVDIVLMAVNEIKKYYNVKITHILPIDLVLLNKVQNEEKLLKYSEV